METIKLKFLFVSALLYCIVLGSCDKQDYDIQISERVFGRLNILEKDLALEVKDGSSLSFDYQVTGAKEQIRLDTKSENNRFRSVLSYNNEESGWIDVSVFEIDLKEVIGKANMNIIVEKQAKTLKKKFDVSTVSRIGDILEGLPELLYNELGQKEYNNELTLSLFYHLAAFNTARRSYESRSRDCQCEVNPNYLSSKSPFFCAEDIMVSTDWAYDLIKKKSEIKKSEKYQFNPETLLKYLRSESGQLVSASKIDKLLREELGYFWRKLDVKERQQINNENYTLSMVPMITTRSETYDGWPGDPECWLFNVRAGSDCGCCGNYSGPCILCSILCKLHDLDCTECLPASYCLSGCVPSGCENLLNY
jgi:hypothetical protein